MLADHRGIPSVLLSLQYFDFHPDQSHSRADNAPDDGRDGQRLKQS
jgi:hypothetical protein